MRPSFCLESPWWKDLARFRPAFSLNADSPRVAAAVIYPAWKLLYPAWKLLYPAWKLLYPAWGSIESREDHPCPAVSSPRPAAIHAVQPPFDDPILDGFRTFRVSFYLS